MDINDIFEFIITEISGLTLNDASSVGLSSNWYELGMDSVEILGLACSIEDKLKINISEETMIDNCTVTDLARHIHLTISQIV